MKNNIFLIKTLAILCMIVTIASYAGYEYRYMWAGPMVVVTSPLNGSTVKAPLVEIKGEARNITSISLNDREITIDDHGVFKEKILLSEGNNIIKLNAKDKFGRTKEEVLEVILKDGGELVRR